MFQPAPWESYVEPVVAINGQTYLGSVMSESATIDDEINPMVARACSSFGNLIENVWKRRGLSFETKLQVYREVVIGQIWTDYPCGMAGLHP